MHPMFVKLYLEPSADDVTEEDSRRRAANRARRARTRVAVVRVTPSRDRAQPPRR
jgi:hypothetical protein